MTPPSWCAPHTTTLSPWFSVASPSIRTLFVNTRDGIDTLSGVVKYAKTLSPDLVCDPSRRGESEWHAVDDRPVLAALTTCARSGGSNL